MERNRKRKNGATKEYISIQSTVNVTVSSQVEKRVGYIDKFMSKADFTARKKPYKELFEQCASGRLLIVTTEQYPEPPRKVDYLHAQELNAIAATLAQLPPSAGRLIPRR